MADFDPAAYADAVEAQARPASARFDPKAYADGVEETLETQPATKQQGPTVGAGSTGEWQSFRRGALQGATFGFSDEGAGATQATLAALSRAFPGLMGHLGIDTRYASELPTAGEAYRAGRDADRSLNEAAQRAHGGYYLGGNLLGGLATAPIGGGIGAGLTGGAKLAALFGTGVGLGALQGLGSSNADLTRGQWAQAGRDTGVNALAGGGLSLGLAGLGMLAPTLKDAAISTGRRVLSGAGLASAGKKALANEAVEQALQDGAIRMFGTTKGAFGRLQNLTEAGGKELAGVEDELVRAGVPTVSAEKIAAPMSVKAAERASVLDKAGARVLGDTAEDLRGLAPGAPRSTGNGVVLGREELQNLSEDEVRRLLGAPGTEATRNARVPQSEDGLPLKQVIGIKRSLQKGAGKAYADLHPNAVREAQMEVAGDLRNAILAHVSENAGLAPEAAAQYGPLNERLSSLIAARDAAEIEVNNAAKRHFFSPMDWISAASTFGGETARGNPAGGLTLGALAGLGSHLARTRGPSTTAAGLYGLAQALRSAAPALSGDAGLTLGQLLGRPLSLRAPLAVSRLGAVSLPQLLRGGSDGTM